MLDDTVDRVGHFNMSSLSPTDYSHHTVYIDHIDIIVNLN